ncbi:MAG: translation initiation factor IF-2 [Patescibacteria group bacterium]
MKKETSKKETSRPPIVAVLGHVDHGKSTLLDHIRKTNTTDKEAGGITQCLSSYEITHTNKETGEETYITFLDTPGHEAFTALRERGTATADVVVLVVSAEDGVMPQTKEVIDNLQATETPFVVAINKIDTPKANIDRTKQSLAENQVYLEEWHGDVPAVEISAKSGEGVPELLDMILLMTEMEELTGDPENEAKGFVLESTVNPKTGIGAMLIIKDGTLRTGEFVVAGNAFSPVRQIQVCDGSTVEERSFSSPVYVAGWNEQPKVGSDFYTVKTKKEAEKKVKESSLSFLSEKQEETGEVEIPDSEIRNIPIILKTDAIGSVEAIKQEIHKVTKKNPDVCFYFITAEAGSVTEKDVQTADIDPETLLLGFNTSINPAAKRVSENLNVEPRFFSVIYELTDWLEDYLKRTRELKETEKEHGALKILKFFSSSKKGHVLGGVIKTGTVSKGDRVKILRNDEEIGQGRVKEMQQQKNPASSVKEGQECGIMLDSPVKPNDGDMLSAFTVVKE